VFEGGWFATGDLGALVDGHLVITGRKREIVVLANGRTLAPRPIERRLMADPLIAQALIHGDRRDFVSLLVALSHDELANFAARHGLAERDTETLVHHARLYAHIEALVEAVNSGLPPHARIKKFAVLTQELVPGLTPTGTVNRKLAERHQRALLDSFYAESF
jgi:long-chain acyl-CoA synthetase